jgi:hypothetical protein
MAAGICSDFCDPNIQFSINLDIRLVFQCLWQRCTANNGATHFRIVITIASTIRTTTRPGARRHEHRRQSGNRRRRDRRRAAHQCRNIRIPIHPKAQKERHGHPVLPASRDGGPN